MAKILNGRMFAKTDSNMVVFLIGMRVNNWWKINKWFPVAMAMPKMLKELYANKDSGFLGSENWFGRTTISVQYWRSFEHLEAYAKNKNAEHYPAWREFNHKVRKSSAVGVWHESYRITKGSYENIYVNMPEFGLGKAANLFEAHGKYEHAAQRMNDNN